MLETSLTPGNLHERDRLIVERTSGATILRVARMAPTVDASRRLGTREGSVDAGIR
jgi:hypothetical protein